MVKVNKYSDPYTRYYLNQVGNGVGTVYRGASYQKGHGIGSFLGGLFRSALPLLKSGARAIGQEAVKTGVNVLSDLTSDYQQPVKRIIRKRVFEAGESLMKRAGNKIRKMTGGGYPRGTRKQITQSNTGNRRRKNGLSTKRKTNTKRIVTKRKKVKNTINGAKDIFS